MKAQNRIVLNTGATYARSLLSVAFGLFSTRWIFKALGQTDLGLYGVVGSVIVFITYINGSLSGSVSRFYAYSIGVGRRVGSAEGQEDLCRWFNMALLVHTVIPLALICIGYPLGIYALQHWLVIPSDRLAACTWVFRMAMLSALCAMIAVPYSAMFQAHQLIAELSLLTMVQTVGNFVCAYLLMRLPCDHLIAYAGYVMLLSISVTAIVVLWAHFKFDCCRVNLRYMLDYLRLRQFFAFAGAKIFGSTCFILRTQGGAILLNRFFMPFVNAAYSISTQVSGHTAALSQALVGALQPVIAAKAGEKDRVGMMKYAVSSCRMASLLVMLFVIPLIVEIDDVLALWLVNPPEYTSMFCGCMLVMLIFDKMSIGYMMAENAYGRKIVFYEILLGLILLSALPLSYVCFRLGASPWIFAANLAGTMFLNSFARVLFCRWQLGMSISKWIMSVLLPIGILSLLSVSFAALPRLFVPAGFGRIMLVGLFSAALIPFLGWKLVFEADERDFMRKLSYQVVERVRNARKHHSKVS